MTIIVNCHLVPEGGSIFSSLVRRVGYLTAAAALSPAVQETQCCSSPGGADFRAYSDCLKLMLDCLPPATSSILTTTTTTTTPSIVLPVGNTSNTQQLTEETNRITSALQLRITTIQQEISALMNQSEAHKQFHKQHSTILETLSVEEMESEDLSQWAAYIAEKERIINKLREKCFSTNLR